MKKIFSLSLALVTLCTAAFAQTPADSVAIVKAKWQKSKLEKGIVARTALFENLYKGPQAVSIVEISPKSKRKIDVAYDHKMVRTSEMAASRPPATSVGRWASEPRVISSPPSER